MSAERTERPDWQNLRMTASYDGRGFHGWQRLRGARTVQGVLESACAEVFGHTSAVRGSGRTDRGVHAHGQVLSVEVPSDVCVDTAAAQLNRVLPQDLRVLAVVPVPAGFHAREDAVAKVYSYLIWNAPACPPEREGRVWHIPETLDTAAMAAAAPIFVGEHDFASFATRPRFQQKSTVRRVDRVSVVAAGEEIRITIRGGGFLYRMVRNLVRALVRVGEGRATAEDLEAALAQRDRHAAPGSAPASGLYLDAVLYPGDPVPEDGR